MEASVYWTIIGALVVLLLKDVILSALRGLASGQNMSSSEIATLKSEVEALKVKQAQHDGLLVAVTELKSEVKHMASTMSGQSQMIAQIVAATIKETFAVLGVRRQVAAGA